MMIQFYKIWLVLFLLAVIANMLDYLLKCGSHFRYKHIIADEVLILWSLNIVQLIIFFMYPVI